MRPIKPNMSYGDSSQLAKEIMKQVNKNIIT